MDSLTLFGLFAVTAMLVTYALEKRSLWFVLAFAGSCLLGSAYGFIPSRRMALRTGRGYLGNRGNAAMVAGKKFKVAQLPGSAEMLKFSN
jgi:hypothetical protein